MLTIMRLATSLSLLILSLGGLCCGAGDEVKPTTGGNGDGGASQGLAPALFDCTATSAPSRQSTIPLSCMLDASCETRLVSGHRSAGGALGVLAPENSLAAVRAAVALGSDFIETDPRTTKDDVLVNMHDSDVGRTTLGEGEVADLTLAEVQALALDAARFDGDFSCERVPTIEDVLAAARGKIHVLLDANKTDRIDLLIAAVHATDTLEWAIFDTDSVEKIDEALGLEPDLHIMIRVADVPELEAELAHFAGHPPAIIELHAGAQPDALVPLVKAAGSRALADAFGTDLAAGLDGDAALYGAIYDQGVMIVQTDRPDLVLRYLGR